MKIGIIVGSNRKLANSLGLAQWVKHHLTSMSTKFEIFTPTNELLTTPINFVPPMAVKSSDSYEDPVIQEYSKKVSACDGFIFISPVYNHSYSGQFKIMIDHLFFELNGKPVVVIGQGPSAAQVAADAMAALATKYSMNVVGKLVINLPREYVTTAQRVSHHYNPEETVDKFLAEHETGLLASLKELTSK